MTIGGQEFELVTKKGVIDEKGNYVIPKEYDRIIKVNPHIFAAIEDLSGMGTPTFQGIVDKGNLTLIGLRHCWKDSLYKNKVLAKKIDFYTAKGKLEFEKKILAYYYSSINGLFILLDEDLKWSIGCIDYPSQKILVNKSITTFESDRNIDRVMENDNGKILIQKNGAYEFVFEGGSRRIGPFEYKFIEPYNKGFVVVLKNNKKGFFSYEGEEILDGLWDDIFPKEDYIEVISSVFPDGGKARGVYSYTGKLIIPCDYYSIMHYKIFSKDLYVAESFGIEGNRWYEIFSQKGKVFKACLGYVDIRTNGRMIYSIAGKYGMSLYDECQDGFIELIPCSFDSMKFVWVNELLVSVKKADKYALYDVNGTQIKRFKYRSFIPKEEWNWYGFTI